MVCTYVVSKTLSQETYMKNKYHYKGRQPSAKTDELTSFGLSKFQRGGIAKPNKFFPIDLIKRQPTHRFPNMDETPST